MATRWPTYVQTVELNGRHHPSLMTWQRAPGEALGGFYAITFLAQGYTLQRDAADVARGLARARGLQYWSPT